MTGPRRPSSGGPISLAYARVVVGGRYVLVLAWAAVVVASLTFLPGLGSGGSGGIDGFVAEDDPALATELRSFEIFGLPLLGRTTLVQRDPDGLSPFTQAEAILRAVAVSQGSYDTDLLGALPVPNALEIFPGSRERGTTILTYGFTDPGGGFGAQFRAAQEFAAEHVNEPDDAYVGIAGSIPARLEQGRITEESLPLLEALTVAAVGLLVALTFRSLVAPVLTLLSAGTASVVTLGVASGLGDALGVAVPSELRPLLVALLLGVVTDYAIFFLSGLRHHLTDGLDRREAAIRATQEVTPIVAVAGVIVAAGTASLVVADSELFRAFGPGMALAVLVGLAVSLTLVPALMAIVGSWTFWPGRITPDEARPQQDDRPSASPFIRFLTWRPTAAVVVLVTVAGLVFLALPLRDLQLGVAFTDSLPDDNPVAVAAAAARKGFSPGVLSPTEVLVEGDDIGDSPDALNELGQLITDQPGVTGVLGPGDVPLLDEELGVLVAPTGDAARYVVVLNNPPLSADAIDDLSQLRERLPRLAERAGLGEVRLGVAGDTALSTGIVTRTEDDLLRISVAALLVNLLLLVLFLRALVAPLLLLASSVLALSASLGLAVLVFQGWLGHDGLTFYVPFAAAVLLLSLGSDYNIFAVGHVWQVARRLPLPEAIRVATPESTRAILSAGAALAASFGMLGLVPLRPFRELAFTLAVGILIDVLVVRSLLVPSLLTLAGRFGGWPWARLTPPRPRRSRRTGPRVV